MKVPTYIYNITFFWISVAMCIKEANENESWDTHFSFGSLFTLNFCQFIVHLSTMTFITSLCWTTFSPLCSLLILCFHRKDVPDLCCICWYIEGPSCLMDTIIPDPWQRNTSWMPQILIPYLFIFVPNHIAGKVKVSLRYYTHLPVKASLT